MRHKVPALLTDIRDAARFIAMSYIWSEL